jgi:hypothetical protein
MDLTVQLNEVDQGLLAKRAPAEGRSEEKIALEAVRDCPARSAAHTSAVRRTAEAQGEKWRELMDRLK